MNVVGEWVQVATLVAVVFSGLGVPFIIRTLNRQDQDRQTLRTEMHEKFDHLDSCVDELKRRVLGEVCTRNDIIATKAETNETLNRMRISLSNETNGLHQRIMRLESAILRLPTYTE